MIKIPIGRSLPIEWSIRRGDCECNEDLSRVKKLCLFFCGTKDKYVADFTEIGANVLRIDIPDDLPEDTYGLEAVWWKDEKYKRSFSKVNDVFSVSEGEYDIHDAAKIKIASHPATYGYDGLDSYELAVLRGVTMLPKSKWISNLAELNEKEAIIQDNERERIASENARRELAESIVIAEEARVVSENNRDAKELQRNAGEEERKKAERLRVASEILREKLIRDYENRLSLLERRVSAIEDGIATPVFVPVGSISISDDVSLAGVYVPSEVESQKTITLNSRATSLTGATPTNRNVSWSIVKGFENVEIEPDLRKCVVRVKADYVPAEMPVIRCTAQDGSGKFADYTIMILQNADSGQKRRGLWELDFRYLYKPGSGIISEIPSAGGTFVADAEGGRSVYSIWNDRSEVLAGFDSLTESDYEAIVVTGENFASVNGNQITFQENTGNDRVFKIAVRAKNEDGTYSTSVHEREYTQKGA